MFKAEGDVVRREDGMEIPLQDFPHLRRMREKDTGSIPCEEKGAALINSGFADENAVSDFLDCVWEFAGMSANRIKGKIRKDESFKAEVVECARKACECLQSGKLEEARAQITKPKGLGISYGSTILRMLMPEKAAMWSNEERWGWIEYCQDCEAAAEVLNKKGIMNPVRTSGKWFVGDVAAATWEAGWVK